MPEMDGLEATAQIRQAPHCQTLPIVAMTASVLQEDRERCQAAGMNDHVAKPIEPDELWQALLKWIPPRTAKAPPATGTSNTEPSTQIAGNPAVLPTIPGLNTAEGLRRVLGKASLYRSMLQKFTTGQKQTIEQIRAALEQNDRPQAERLAHTLKGVAGNIGAGPIQEAAAILETAIRNQAPQAEIDRLLPPLQAALMALIDPLEQMLPPPADAVKADIDWTKLETICTRLSELLLESDAEAADQLHDHRELLRQAFPDSYEQLEANISSFDFEAAYTVLMAAKQMLQPEP
jgi:two-component system, sensor histidine kinase and response regulator